MKTFTLVLQGKGVGHVTKMWDAALAIWSVYRSTECYLQVLFRTSAVSCRFGEVQKRHGMKFCIRARRDLRLP